MAGGGPHRLVLSKLFGINIDLKEEKEKVVGCGYVIGHGEGKLVELGERGSAYLREG